MGWVFANNWHLGRNNRAFCIGLAWLEMTSPPPFWSFFPPRFVPITTQFVTNCVKSKIRPLPTPPEQQRPPVCLRALDVPVKLPSMSLTAESVCDLMGRLMELFDYSTGLARVKSSDNHVQQS